MSPEQARGGSVDRRTDVFALGIVLYQLTTGQHPFRGDNEVATLYNICSDEPVEPPSAQVPGYPQSLEGVVMSALAKVADDRYATASDLHRALEAVAKELGAAREADVAKLMRDLLGERQGKRHDSLKAALRVADNRTAGNRLSKPPGELERLSHSGFTPVSNVARPSAAPTAMVGAVSQPPRDEDNPFNRKKATRGKIIAAGAVLVAIGLTLFAMLRPAPPLQFPPMPAGAVLTQPATTTVDTTVAAPTSEEPHAPAAAEAPPTPIASAALKPIPKALAPKPLAPAAPKVAAAPVAAPKSSSTTFVAPVRNPGF